MLLPHPIKLDLFGLVQSLLVAVYVIGRKENGHISFIKYFEYAYTKQIRTAELVIAGIKNQWLLS